MAVLGSATGAEAEACRTCWPSTPDSRAPGGPGLTLGLAGRLLWWVLGLAVALAATVAALAAGCGTAIAVTASGTVVPSERRLVKTALSAVVRRVAVRQGDRIAAGDTLAQLDDAPWRAALEQTLAALDQNRVRQQALEAEIRTQRLILQRERQRCELELGQSWLALQRLQAEAAVEDSAARLLGLRRLPFAARVPARQALQQVQQCSLALELAGQRLEALADRRLDLEALGRARLQLQQDSLRGVQTLREATILAPIAGTVLTDRVETRTGDYLPAGAVVLELAPLAGWQAELWVSERDVPRVQPGQAVRLFVQAFPHLEYKVFGGRVESVSLEAAPAGQYRTQVRIDDPAVRDGDQTRSLACGMRAEAQIVVARGRIATLLWRQLLRRAGPAARRELRFVGRAGRATCDP